MDLKVSRNNPGYPENFPLVTAIPSSEGGYFVASNGHFTRTVTELSLEDCSDLDITSIEERRLTDNRPLIEVDTSIPGGLRAVGRKILRFAVENPGQPTTYVTATRIQEFMPAPFHVAES